IMHHQSVELTTAINGATGLLNQRLCQMWKGDAWVMVETPSSLRGSKRAGSLWQGAQSRSHAVCRSKVLFHQLFVPLLQSRFNLWDFNDIRFRLSKINLCRN